jgi:hypothetical protein
MEATWRRIQSVVERCSFGDPPESSGGATHVRPKEDNLLSGSRLRARLAANEERVHRA